MNVTLDPKDQKDLEALARSSGKDPGEMLRELLHEALAERKRNGTLPSPEAGASEESCYELAVKAGIIGQVDGLPADWRTNPKTWESFGRG